MDSDSFLAVFLALNVAFLAGTAVWFRLDHADSPVRFEKLLKIKILDDLMWQYSLRSNLLFWGCVQAAYLIYIGELSFLLYLFAGFSLLNVLTDIFYEYEEAPAFYQVKRGHIIAGVFIWLVAAIYFAVL